MAGDLDLAHPRDVELRSAFTANQKHIEILYVFGFDFFSRSNAGNGAEKHEPGDSDDQKEDDRDEPKKPGGDAEHALKLTG